MDSEMNAMSQIVEVFEGLEDAARARVLRWAADRFNLGKQLESKLNSTSRGTRVDTPDDLTDFTELADLYDATNPGSQGEKALVVGYWLQIVGGQEDWESQTVNTELKNLGHGLKNITDALNTLIEQSPRLVIQTRKSGTSKQARKRYKLTLEGIRKIKNLLVQGAGSKS